MLLEVVVVGRFYPELGMVTDREQRHLMFKRASRRIFSNYIAWIVALPGTIGLVLLLRYVNHCSTSTITYCPVHYSSGYT